MDRKTIKDSLITGFAGKSDLPGRCRTFGR